MPDGDWYQINTPLRSMVFAHYNEDAAEEGSTLHHCKSKSYFYETWTDNFPEIRLRKWCRFAKCDFCVDWRRLAQVNSRKAEAQERLKVHRAWANVRERGLFHKKQEKARRKPSEFMSVSIDGMCVLVFFSLMACVCVFPFFLPFLFFLFTFLFLFIKNHHVLNIALTLFFYTHTKGTDKFPHGFPHYWENCKDDSTYGDRLGIHIDIACVHGSRPHMYLAYENMFSDPNMTCEVLYRTLRKEQELRGGGPLPPTLFLQMDNCIRENKNTTLFCYVAWLVERGIFDTAFVSFLPVGHTHFDCDRVASRISTAMKYRDVTALSELESILEGCNNPSPFVDTIEAVTDIKGLFNPSGNPNMPVSSSRVHRMVGCATKVPPALHQQEYCLETSPLHWRIGRDLDGKTVIQSKLICDDEQWSAQHYPWTKDAPRPKGRTFEEKTSGVRPSDLTMAAQKPLSDTRTKELERSMQHVKFKLTEEDWEGANAVWDIVKHDRHLDQRPVPNAGLFMGENDDPEERELARHRAAAKGAPDLFARPLTRVFENTNRQAIDRENRKNQGRATSKLVVGKLVAVTVNYTDSVKDKDRNDFWVAKILSLDLDSHQVQVSYYNTGTIQNGGDKGGKRAKYRAWVGKDSMEWCDITRVLHTFDKFTDRGLIIAADRRRICKALALPPDSDDSDSGGDSEVDLTGLADPEEEDFSEEEFGN
jgi:hypothetical protein